VSTTEGIPPQAIPADRRVSLMAPIETGQDVVTVRLPADPAYLAVLRTTTASLAARLDFTLDEIEDLRIAVDEACCLLLAGAQSGSDLSCSFELASDTIAVTVSAASGAGHSPSRDSFAWTVLSALAGQVDTWSDSDGRSVIALTKQRARGGSA